MVRGARGGMNQLEPATEAGGGSGGGSGVGGGIGRPGGGVGKMKRRSKGPRREREIERERAGLKRCRTLTNLNATCFKLCQSERETPTLETSCVIALKPKRRAGAGETLSNPLSPDGLSFRAYSGVGTSYPRGDFATRMPNVSSMSRLMRTVGNLIDRFKRSELFIRQRRAYRPRTFSLNSL